MCQFGRVILSVVRSTESIYETCQLVDVVELGSKEQDLL